MSEPKRLPPDLNDLPPLLRDAVGYCLHHYRGPEGITLNMFEIRRTAERQQWLFAEGTTRADGVTSYGLHQYPVAFDLVCKRDGKWTWGADWNETQALYNPLGAVVHEMQDKGWPVEWGGDWRRLRDYPHGDYPHVQVSKVEHARWFQKLLNAYGVGALTVDGVVGPKTREAAKAAGFALGADDGDRLGPNLWGALFRECGDVLK